MANRTKKGNVTAAARDKYGGKNGDFPVFDEHSARSALKLRHNGKHTSSSAVISKVRRWASAHHNEAVKKAADKAAKADKGG